ncbi:MlaC/ttg2D family ABC transporter substrate-binding protein [Sandaracinus amylolyticus]|uniref:MlaC/ttg2D family ABC transporter substrate-binding protein n=1 Tax=Sandaracinus amylolyticus TaxID=927083 RepID=UPI001F395BFD|nr:ABC transporter substrate-binding protein [Sandaracinus amylolyticus]UJR79154.1 Toluene tolerance [Sandaracinus amylolyticus]
MTMRTIFLALALAALSFTSIASIASAQEGGAATRFLRQRHDEVTRIMRRDASTDAARAARSQEVTRILSQLLDYQELSRRALGTHWESRTPAQRTQFVDLLRQLVERNYEANLERIQDFEVRYTREEAISDGTVVFTEARSRQERRQPPVEISYSMHLTEGAWRVFDVNTDGVSLVRNYNRQFNRIIGQDGWDALITRMQERLASGRTE